MEILVRVVQVQTPQSGTSNAGKSWMKQLFVVETEGQYPKKIAMTLWGEEKINKYDLEIGLLATFKFNVESREYNGKWYTDVQVYDITWDANQRKWQPGQQPAKSQAPAPSAYDDPFDTGARLPSAPAAPVDTSDLPF